MLRHRLFWIALLSLLLATGPGFAQVAVAAQSDGTPSAGNEATGPDSVSAYRNQVQSKPSAFGPAQGTLDHSATEVAHAAAGVDLYNFYATVRVTAPYNGADHLWDAGLVFRAGRDAGWRFIVYSDGTWEARIGGNDPTATGTLASLKTGAGQTDTIEIAVVDDTAYIAVNRHELGSFDVSARRIAGDVDFAIGFANNSFQNGATTPYARFQVWELPDDGATPPIARDAVALLEQGRDVADTSDPIGGPTDGTLTETTDGTVDLSRLDVTAADLYASAEVTTPRDGKTAPFDVGFLLRDTGDNQYRLVFASDGTWYLRHAQDAATAAGRFAGLKAGAGEKNLFEFAASGDTLVFAVNGEAVGSADIGAATGAGDVALGAGFYGEQDVVAGDTSAFSAFTAWALGNTAPSTHTTTATSASPPASKTATRTSTPASKTATPNATKTPVPTAEPTEAPTTVPAATDPAKIFAAYLDAEPELTTLFGPDAGDLTQASDSIAYANANVDVADFIAHTEFTNPFAASEGGWDVGFFFRVGQSDPHFRLVITSTGNWYLTPSAGDPIQQGGVPNLKTRANQSNAIDLVVVGDTGYFGVNGEFVNQLDLSSVTQSGDVAVGTSFFQDNFKAGAVTSYKNFVVWKVNPSVIGGTPTATSAPAATSTPRTGKTATPTAGALYTSETYGYTVAYGDAWNITDQSSDGGTDYARFTDGVSTIDFTGSETDFTPQECLDDEFGYYQSANGYSDAALAQDQQGNDLTGELGDGVFGVYTFTFTDQDGNPNDYAAYVECQPLKPGVSMLKIVQFVEYDRYNDEIEARKALLAGVSLEGAPGPEPTATPEETVTPEPTTATEEATATGSPTELALAASVKEVDGSGVSAIASITFDGDKASVLIFAFGADDGTVAAIQQGSCDDLPGKAAFKLQPIVGSLSDSTITASYDDLLNGGYVITLSKKGGSLARPLACGELFA